MIRQEGHFESNVLFQGNQISQIPLTSVHTILRSNFSFCDIFSLSKGLGEWWNGKFFFTTSVLEQVVIIDLESRFQPSLVNDG
jgi:hypothetical protein